MNGVYVYAAGTVAFLAIAAWLRSRIGLAPAAFCVVGVIYWTSPFGDGAA
jgi:hypothetical protein